MKTRVVREVNLFVLFIVFAICINSASAVPTGVLLPESSFEDGAWQGYTFYDKLLDEETDKYLRGRIDFAVYDSENLEPGSAEESLVTELALEGRFVYAYQIINDFDASDAAVEYFAIFGKQQMPLGLYEDSIGCYDDGSGGKPSTDEYLTGDQLRVVWEFTDGLLWKGDHSWFLVFGSDYSPVAGDYEIKASEQMQPPSPGEVPEPATIVLLGFGYALVRAVTKRRTFI
jgi:hypothetical protein